MTLRAFANAVGAPLADWQAQALDPLDKPVTAIVAPRQSGKSRSLAVTALWWAFRKRGQRVLLLSAGEEASRRLLAEVRRIATASPMLAGSLVDEQGLLTATNGSEIRSVPASERQVRGWSVDLLAVDEAALVGDDLLLGAAFPTVAARPDARIVLASSATVASGAFFDLAVRGERGDEHVRTWRWKLEDARWLTPSAVAAMRASMSETRFRAEMLGEFAVGGDYLFSRARLDPVIVDYLPTPLGELRPHARLAGGCDWGITVDRTVFTALGRLAGTDAFGIVCSHRWSEGYPPLRSAEETAASPGHFSWVASESNGLGGPLSDHLFQRIVKRSPESGGGLRRRAILVEEGTTNPFRPRPARPPEERPQGFATAKWRVHTTAESKAAAYSALRLLVDEERLLIPASADELIRELLLLRVDLSPTGSERIEAASGHDDAADSLALALLPYKRERDWRVHLADLSRHRTPPVPVPDLPLPMVETPAGPIYRRPVWQSVGGQELTTPAGIEPRQPNADLREALARRKEITHAA